MDDLDRSRIVRGKKKRTTWPAAVSQRPADLVERKFSATAPNRLWLADLTYVSTWSGFCQALFGCPLKVSMTAAGRGFAVR